MSMMFGRAPEWRQLVASVERVRSGLAVAIAIEGEAGIGKTRLLDEIVTLVAADGWRSVTNDSTVVESLSSGRVYRSKSRPRRSRSWAK